MDLRQLEYFVHVADAGSFSRAAQLLSVAQPALSPRIRSLEVEFRDGAKLVARPIVGPALRSVMAVATSAQRPLTRMAQEPPASFSGWGRPCSPAEGATPE